LPWKFPLLLISSIFLLVFWGSIGTISIGTAIIGHEMKELPDPMPAVDLRIEPPSIIFAADGASMGEFSSHLSHPVPLKNIPPLLISAFLSAEDKEFWNHSGVDPLAIIRAAITDFTTRGSGRRPFGASTITQQLIKNTLTGDEQTLSRKIREALLSLRLEREVSKERILESYLNRIYLGFGAYGVEAASQVYFNKPMSSLNLAECALLAGLPKAPANYDPIHHPEAAIVRRTYVLERMAEDHVISDREAHEAMFASLPHPVAKNFSGPAQGWFAEEVRREIVALPNGTARLYGGGLVIHTSMDPVLQRLAETSLQDGLCAYDRRHGWRGALIRLPMSSLISGSWPFSLASLDTPSYPLSWRIAVVLSVSPQTTRIGFADKTMAILPQKGLTWTRAHQASSILSLGDVILVSNTDGYFQLQQIPQVEGSVVVMDVHNGRVLAIAGGFTYTQGGFNRAVQSLRQPGSTFKPFIYLDAFENGFEPSSPLLDDLISVDMGRRMPRWTPGADGGQGWGIITARRALENSRNLASVRLLYGLGMNSIADLTRRMNIYGEIPNYAAALGALEVSQLRLTSAYASFANGGLKVDPNFIDSIADTTGKLSFNHSAIRSNESQIIANPVAVARLVSVLRGVPLRGTAAVQLAPLARRYPIAGKTGTTNESMDAWFEGFTPDIVVGVHVGFDRPKSLGAREMGANVAGPIFNEFMQTALVLHPPSSTTFPIPSGYHIEKLDPITGLASPNGDEEIVKDESTRTNNNQTP
jgi:penicillin-binding protein 1A